MKIGRVLHRAVRLGGLAAFALIGAASAFAFQSVGREYFSAGTFTLGLSSGNLKIQHTNLIKASPVTKQVIILGEAGTEVPPTPPPYEQRLTQVSNFPFDQRLIRVTLMYRYVPTIDPIENENVPLTELPLIEGPDPTAFAFQVPASSVTTGFLQYRIVAEYLQLVEGALEPIARVTHPPTTAQTPNPFVEVGVTANASEQFGPEGGRFVLGDGNPADGQTALDIPAGLFSGPTQITMDEIQPGSGIIPSGLDSPIRVYHLDSEASIRGLLQLSLLYPDFEYPVGQDSVVDGTSVSERNLVIVYWDGFSWRRLGGTVNARSNTISVKIGSLNFFAVVAAPPLSPQDRRPVQRIITPNGDIINDEAEFTLGDLTENIKIEIFDVTGHRVRTIYSQTSLKWDGRDDSGSIVESGVYIYQYKIDGQLVSGIIAVAK